MDPKLTQNGVLARDLIFNDFLNDSGRPFGLSFPTFDLRSATFGLSCPTSGLRLALLSDIWAPFGDIWAPIFGFSLKRRPKGSQIDLKMGSKGIEHRRPSNLEKTRMLRTKTLKWTPRPRPNPNIGAPIRELEPKYPFEASKTKTGAQI